MGIAERKSKQKEELRQNILDAAKRLFLKEGYHATSIRKIAKEIEFSPTTIYLYYKDKAEIAHALHIEGFKLLGRQFGLLMHIDDPFERIKVMGRIYMQFSLENTDFYELMFVLKEPMDHIKECGMEEGWEEGDQAFNLLMQNVLACQEVGYFKSFDPAKIALIAWSTLHGLCTLNLHGHLAFVKTYKGEFTHIEDLFTSTFNTFVTILEQLK
ncbi:MAG: TetR/AcrR family transcriptional regulator [Saprospiraceae bacterium]|nr:MAG: TetR family transcriptional regulator [Candidatus Parvibacillus calidus]MCC7149870.1 TetR/AcrR family transcriptional regulator [Saprospiraceae bacterium]WKZ62297.1 MAG: TetR/AcrR family transcriptional regulator [Saprospiraceae bacterium]